MNTLSLIITNLDQLQHDVTTRHRFDCKGGTIGSGQADWQLNDRDQTIAPIHCEIRWVESSFCVIDHCHRTYLNDSVNSLGAMPPRRLLEGDHLRIGAYRLLVQYAQEQTCERSLEDLFNPERSLLDHLIAESPVSPWSLPPSPPQPAAEICSIFEPAKGNDPLAALNSTGSGAAAENPLQRLIAGERP